MENWTSITNVAKGRLGSQVELDSHDGHGARRRHGRRPPEQWFGPGHGARRVRRAEPAGPARAVGPAAGRSDAAPAARTAEAWRPRSVAGDLASAGAAEVPEGVVAGRRAGTRGPGDPPRRGGLAAGEAELLDSRRFQDWLAAGGRRRRLRMPVAVTVARRGAVEPARRHGPLQRGPCTPCGSGSSGSRAITPGRRTRRRAPGASSPTSASLPETRRRGRGPELRAAVPEPGRRSGRPSWCRPSAPTGCAGYPTAGCWCGGTSAVDEAVLRMQNLALFL